MTTRSYLSGIIGIVFSVAPFMAGADVDLSQTPLAKASAQTVKPNLLYILDDSRSMAFQYTPDYVSTDYTSTGGEPNGTSYPVFATTAGGSRGGISCRGSSDGSLTTFETCMVGDPPYMAAQFNSQYYNPRIRYIPGIKADGSSYPSMNATNTSNWTQVPLDGYNVQLINHRWIKTSTTATIGSTSYYTEDLTANVPDRLWCNSDGATALGSGCVANSSYTYPNGTYGDGRSGGTTGTVKYTTSGPYYYNIKPIYCTDSNGTDCSTTQGGSYQTQLPFRWCTSSSWTATGWTSPNCQARRTGSYTLPSFLQPESGTYAIGSFTVGTSAKNKTLTVTVTAGTTTHTILSSWSSGSTNAASNAAMAVRVKDAINANSASNYTASCIDTTCSNSVVTLAANSIGSTYNGTLSTSGNFSTSSLVNPVGGSGSFAYFTKINIVSGGTYLVDGGIPTGRSDCSTGGCTYGQEMENYANWFAYYRTRLQAMKSATTQAFQGVDDNKRLGFATIKELEANTYAVPIDSFGTTQKRAWFNKLIGANIASNGGTPLRTSLDFAGRLYAGKTSFTDPMQYSCQQNFTLLTTDGYWGDGSYAANKLDGGSIGNQDGGTTPRPYYEPNSTSGTLADIAMYYYNTDIRNSAFSNCTSGGTSEDVCEDNVPISNSDTNKKQHMVTYSLGLGVDGTLKYRSDYQTALSGDFYAIKNNSLDWPNPTTGDTKVDDLWHAAVNGRGVYYSAKDPAGLISGLKAALTSMGASTGIGASAATSTSEPVSGDNFAYIATYTTAKWTGNLEARLISLTDGTVGKQPQWCAESIAADPDNGIATACTGTMTSKVAASSDTRTIYFNDNGTLTSFTASNLNTAGKTAYFNASQTNQYATWSDAYQTAAAASNNEKLVNYLRGQWGDDTRAANTYRLFRERETTLGDFVGSSPKYVYRKSATYSDLGYSEFGTSTLAHGGISDRTPAIYVGGNDGMLHAFNGSNGNELWAFVPTPALHEMWRLADDTYSSNHRFYVDGTVTVGDVCTSNCDSASLATWKTVLVAALGSGVKTDGNPVSGYFALDVTDPSTPSLLWEVTSSHATLGSKIGYALGKPWIGKVKDSSNNTKWAVLLSSGVNPSDGNGELIVLEAYSGNLIRNINLPDAIGFSRFSPVVTDPGVNQTFVNIYGGDLSGNVWRIDPNQASDVTKVLSGAPAITTAPELGTCNGKTVVFIGSGKLLETDDLTNRDQQSIFGFVDDGTAITSPKTALQQLTISGTAIAGSTDDATKKGWYIDLPGLPAEGEGGSERVALVDPKIEGGLLNFVTNTPKKGICYASGESHLYQLQISSCTAGNIFPKVEEGAISAIGNYLTVGITFIKLPDGTIKIIATGSDGTITTKNSNSTSAGAFGSKRVSWRELINE